MLTRNFIASIFLLMSFFTFGQTKVGLPKMELNFDTSTTPGAIIKFSKDKFDFGIVTQGTKMWDTVFITNIGNRDLHIEDIQTSDGGSATGTWTRVLKPNEKGFIVGGFPYTSGMIGTHQKHLQIRSNALNGQQYMILFPMYIEVKEKDEK